MRKEALEKSITTLSVFFLLSLFIFSIPSFAQQPPVKPIELKFASISSPTHVLNVKVHKPWIEQVEKASNGRLKITLFVGGVLGGAKQAYDLASKGIADISYGWVHYHPGRFPLTEVYTLPSVVPDLDSAYHIRDVYQKYFKKEWSDTRLLWLGLAPGYNLQTRNKKINKVEDIKGLKLAAWGSISTKVVRALGAVPIDVTTQDTYTALQRGVVDGCINTWSSAAANKHGEVMQYFTNNTRFYTGVLYCTMNLDKYKSLPPELRKVIDDNTGPDAWRVASKAYWDDEEQAIKKVMEQTAGKGVNYSLPPEELKKIRVLMKPIWDEWEANLQSKKLPAKEVLDTVLKYAKE